MKWAPKSLGGRLLLSASVFILVALILTGVVMDFALRRFIQGQVDGRLDGQILTVTDALRTNSDGSVQLERTVDGPPFERPLSGWYWEVLSSGPALRSTSLLSQDIALAQNISESLPKPITVEGRGPSNEPLRVRVQRVRVGSTVVTIASSAPLHALSGPLREALMPLVVTLVLLAIGLICGVLLQVHFGLRPLSKLRGDLAEVRTGKIQRIMSVQPSEVRPLVAELNTLLDQNALNLERARRHVANLAHGLKTPLATLSLALEEPGRDEDGRLRPLVAVMDRRIRHHLARARASALGGAERAQTSLAPRVADHVAAFRRLYADKSLEFVVDIDVDAAVACEAQDLDEMLGNLLDNACKWGRKRIAVSTRLADASTRILIEDDGPGLSNEQVADVMRPGKRLDEAAPGYGFGLPIARELSELYGGSLKMTRQGPAGLAVELTLPSALARDVTSKVGESRYPK